MENNILWFDIESTGLELHKERIVTISFIFNDKKKTIIVNPGKSIPQEATNIHGIKDSDVADCLPLSSYAQQIFDLCNKADYYAGYNIRKYDIVLLQIEMLRCGYDIPQKPIIDVYEMAQSLFKSLKLKDIYRVLCKEELKNAHDSSADIDATFSIYDTIIKKYLNNG